MWRRNRKRTGRHLPADGSDCSHETFCLGTDICCVATDYEAEVN